MQVSRRHITCALSVAAAATVFGFVPQCAAATTAALTVTPESVMQGEPALVVVAASAGVVETLTFKGVPVPLLSLRGERVAVLGVDFREAPGSYPVRAKFTDGSEASVVLEVRQRPREVGEAPSGIPDELGGDTAAGSIALLARLAAENALLAGLWTNPRMLWTEQFRMPVASPVVTDRYGYVRSTGSSDVAHKGTDFRAPVGTRVYAMNRGVVRLTRRFTVYGNAVVVDHGRGIQTLYLHLSRIAVNAGQLVLPGQLLGYSGATGYASGPHLHVSVKVSGVSVDPERFLALFSPAGLSGR